MTIMDYDGQNLQARFLTGKLIDSKHAGLRDGDEHPLGAIAREIVRREDLLSVMRIF